MSTYVPVIDTFTAPDTVNDPVLPCVPVRVFHEPSRSSVQEAPGSVKTVQTVSVNGELQESETIGGVVSGTGFTNTVRRRELMFPAISTFLYSRK